jgi:hypothetical protein
MAHPFKPVPTAVDRWTTEVKAYGVAEVALLSGLALGRSRDLSPCPACGAERRGCSDPRGPAGLTPDAGVGDATAVPPAGTPSPWWSGS